MKKPSIKSIGKIKYVVSTVTAIIAAGLSLILSYSIQFSASNLVIYLIPIVLFPILIFGFEIWRRRKLKDTIKVTNILSFLNELSDKLKRDINKELRANIMVKVGQNHLKMLSSETSEAHIQSLYLNINHTISGTAIFNKEPLFITIDDKIKSEKYSSFPKTKTQIRSLIAIPIIDESGKAFAVINIESREKVTNEDFQRVKDEISKSMETLKKATKSAYTYSE